MLRLNEKSRNNQLNIKPRTNKTKTSVTSHLCNLLGFIVKLLLLYPACSNIFAITPQLQLSFTICRFMYIVITNKYCNNTPHNMVYYCLPQCACSTSLVHATQLKSLILHPYSAQASTVSCHQILMFQL